MADAMISYVLKSRYGCNTPRPGTVYKHQLTESQSQGTNC